MAAGISLMYKQSGGCDYKHHCKECWHFQTDTAGKHIRYYCKAHPFGGEGWKPDLLACKAYLASEKEMVIREESNGQLTLFTN